MEDTVFAKIIKGEIPCTKVYEDEICIAFLDLHPINIGHTLIIPKEGSRNIFDLQDDIGKHLFIIAKKIAVALKESLMVDGINIFMNNEEAAGQVIFYSHLHVIPRYHQDGFKHWHGTHDYTEKEKELVAQKIKKFLT